VQHSFLTYLAAVCVFVYGCRQTPDFGPPQPPPFKLITTEDLLSVSSPDINNVWITGLNAIILHSGNAGFDWEFQKAPVTKDLYSIYFIDTKKGWAVGKHGTVITTNDGGKTWLDLSKHTESDKKLMDVYFATHKNGWVVGVYGTIFCTDDAGKTWKQQGLDEDRIYNSVFFLDRHRGWIVGEYGTILRTEDGGKEWKKQDCKDLVPIVDMEEYAPPLPSLYDVYFTSKTRGWAVGLDGVIIFTQDGGENWKKMASPIDLTLFQVKIIESQGWAAGLRGNYMVSSDAGGSWNAREKALPTKFWLRGLDFADIKNGWLVGSKGTIIHTTNGGTTWKMLSGITLPDSNAKID